MSQRPDQLRPVPTRIAVLHDLDGAWRLLVAENGEGLSVIEALSVSPAGAPASIAQVLAVVRRHRVPRLMRVIPSGQTICRTVSVPPGPANDTLGAISLLLEAQLPESIPVHRRAGGLIPGDAAGASRTGLLTGWASANGSVPPPLARGLPESWVAEISALAMLRGEGAWAASADLSDGTLPAVAVLVSGPRRTLARVTRLPPGGSPGAMVQAAMADSCRAVDAAPIALPSGAAGPYLPPESVDGIRRVIRGAAPTADWMKQFGIALGAAMATLAAEPEIRPLTQITAEPRAVRRGLAVEALARLSTPRIAYATLAAGLLVGLLGPLVAAAARVGILDSKAAAIESGREARQVTTLRAALYRQLESSRWPMTKLVADVSGATPVGIQIDSLRLSPEQGLSLEGRADNGELFNQLESRLMRTGIFTNVKIDRSESGPAGGVSFVLSARVVSPQVAIKPADDFAAEPLAARLYGAGASNLVPPVRSGEEEPSRTERPRVSRAAEDEAPDSVAPAPAKSTALKEDEPPEKKSESDLPEVLSDADIARMERGEAVKAFAARQSVLRSRKDLDPAVKERLEAEVEKLREKMRSTQATQPAAAPKGGGG